MNTELSEAYFGVYTSSKEILKNSQRHLFCNMLDLLTNTCKTTGILCSKIPNDEQVQFWISNILPLVFDEDSSIQASAVAAMEQGLLHIDIATVHGSSYWGTLKSDIVTKLAPLINKFREEKNEYWHQIWCILIQILDKEILKGASTINSFLSIVELGFRNADNKIRAEAFQCWRLLIKIFAKYSELSSPKRMKLICIPLKSSQSKSNQAAEVKLRVWWYLFSCLGSQLENYFENVVESFLVFCFGSSKNNIPALIHQYPSNRELALICLNALISTENNTFLERILRDKNLEKLSNPSPIMKLTVFEKFGHTLGVSIIEALHLFDNENNLSDIEQQILHLLVKNLAITIIKFDIPSFRIFVFGELAKFSNVQTKPIIPFLNTFASDGFVVQNSLENMDDYKRILNKFLHLLYSFKAVIPRAILQRSVDNIFKLPEVGLRSSQMADVSNILNAIMESDDDIDFDYFEIKLIIWRKASQQVVNMLKDSNMNLRMSEFTLLLQTWIMWPIKVASSFAGHRVNLTFDSYFWEMWRQLVLNGQNSFVGNTLLNNINSILNEIIISFKDEAWLPDIYDVYVQAVLKYGFINDETLRISIVEFLKTVLKSKVQSKIREGCLNSFRNMISELKKSDFESFFPDTKVITAEILKLGAKGDINNQYCDEWKRAILEKTKSFQNKSLLSQLKDVFKGTDVFVIIPSVWSLNPEKLTERQKERFSEKNDIPALYNDMSQSQDSSIKPWTPKKIVLLKEDQKEISIANPNQLSMENRENCCVEIEELEDRNFTPVKKANFKKPDQSETFESKEYNFRKRSAFADESNKADTNINPSLALSTPETHTQRMYRSNLRNKATEDPNDKPQSATKSPTKSKKTNTPLKSLKEQPVVNDDVIPETETQEKKLEETAEEGKEEQASNKEVIIISEIDLTETNKDNCVGEDRITCQPQKQLEIIEIKEISPKKSIPQKFSSLGSPPDRRLTNNSSSPTLRPKPCAHLTGRGAQLINMIRNKKPDSPHPAINKQISNHNNQREEKKIEVNPITSDLMELAATDNTSTPLAKDLLIFSKRLPSPTASPSASILKRKLRRESIEDISIESPALKRKRVSFHDPPVSVTKEYIKDPDDLKSKPKRCLIPDKQNQNNSNCTPEPPKHTLKRRSKLDSIIEIEKCGTSHQSTSNSFINKASKLNDDNMSSLKWNDSHPSAEKSSNETTSLQNCNANNSMMDLDGALEIVMRNYSIDDLLEKLFSSSNIQPIKGSLSLAKFISNQMGINSKIKAAVLETLSENHSKDFLDHAVQENLSSVVCDRLNLNSVIDYICAKSKINTNCRNNLLQQIPDVLKNCRVDVEKFNFVKDLLNDCTFTDENILEIISLLMSKRPKFESNSTGCVSESAVDSSSNL